MVGEGQGQLETRATPAHDAVSGQGWGWGHQEPSAPHTWLWRCQGTPALAQGWGHHDWYVQPVVGVNH